MTEDIRGLVAELHRAPGWPTLARKAVDALKGQAGTIDALQARVSGLEAELAEAKEGWHVEMPNAGQMRAENQRLREAIVYADQVLEFLGLDGNTLARLNLKAALQRKAGE